jgi:serine/threonine-protein kinase
MADSRREQDLPPVYVIESIPVGGPHEVKPDEVASEKIPTPAHLRVYKEFGRGGMGHVHPATDRNLLRHVALKRLDKGLVSERFYVEGFIAEAQIAGQLEHPNIVPVHELALDPSGVPYFTMKLVQGSSLDGWLRKHPIGTPDRMTQGLEIFIKLCDAVAYAHHRGVIHRDLKPANVMVGDFGQVYLMDWGLSRLTRTQPASGQNSQMNAPGAVGTPDYMAPEQAKGDPTIMDERCDIFGLGAMLYELVSGKRPYGDHPDGRVILERALKAEIRSIDEHAQKVGISRRMRNIVAKAIAVNPKERYQTVAELQRDVHDFLLGGLHLPRKLFEPGTVIMREGDPGDAAYMIVSGRCRAYRNVDGQEETLAIMEPGEVFGEMALLLDDPRAASVVAMDRVVVLVLDKATMDQGLGLEGWTGALVRALAQRFRNLEQQVRSSGLRRG